MRSRGAGRRTVTIVNTLPEALKHFESAVVSMIDDGQPVHVLRPTVEVGGLGRFERVRAQVMALARITRAGLSSSTILTLWPALGLAEPFMWRVLPGRGERFILIHDPVPLRRQFGYSPLARVLGGWGARGARVRVIAHTRMAAASLEQQGITVDDVLPHPINVESRRCAPSPLAPRVLVAGQYKNARDTRLLEQLGRHAPESWTLLIKGRGWPEIRGWDVESRFLTEDELDKQISASSVVLLPYKHYFQSGIATRAFELGVPVVAQRHEFIDSLFGRDWPGYPESDAPEEWVRAIDSSLARDVPEIATYARHCRSKWRSKLLKESPADPDESPTGSTHGTPPKGGSSGQ